MVRCEALTEKGVQCKLPAVSGSKYCRIHDKKASACTPKRASPLKQLPLKSPSPKKVSSATARSCQEAVNILGAKRVKEILDEEIVGWQSDQEELTRIRASIDTTGKTCKKDKHPKCRAWCNGTTGKWECIPKKHMQEITQLQK